MVVDAALLTGWHEHAPGGVALQPVRFRVVRLFVRLQFGVRVEVFGQGNAQCRFADAARPEHRDHHFPLVEPAPQVAQRRGEKPALFPQREAGFDRDAGLDGHGAL